MEITQTLPKKYQIQNYTVTLNTIPHSRNKRCQLNVPLRHFASNTNKPKLHESCSTKSKPYSMLQIKTFFVVLLKKSFVIHLCCLKKYSVREINNFPKRYRFNKQTQVNIFDISHYHIFLSFFVHNTINDVRPSIQWRLLTKPKLSKWTTLMIC